MKKRIVITAALALTLSAGVFAACDASASRTPDLPGGAGDHATIDTTLPSSESGDQTGYRLSFDSCGGTPVDAVNYPKHAYLVAPEEPTREGYRFDGWYWDQEYTREFVFATNTMPAADVTVYAKWTKLYTVTFVDSRDDSVISSVAGEEGLVLAAPATPVREGYVFDGWFADAEGTTPYVFTTIPAQDITVYAHWHERQTNISVTLMPNTPVQTAAQSASATAAEGEALDTDADETFTAALTEAMGAPVYTFGYWSYDEAGRQPVGEAMGHSESGSVTLYAQWTRSSAYASLTFVNESETLILYVEKRSALSGEQIARVNAFYGGTAPALMTESGASFSLSDPAERDMLLSPEIPYDDFSFVVESRYCYLEQYTGNSAEVNVPSVYRNLPVVGIADDAFAGNTYVQTVSLPSSISSIGAHAFSGCTSLVSVVGADGVSDIGDGAFDGCDSLQTFEQNGFVYLNASCRTLLGYAGGSDRITVPAYAAAIAEGAFRGTSLRSVSFAAGCAVERIPAYAFYGCASLASIDLSALPLESVGESAFEGCSMLESVSLAQRTAKVGAHAFKDCTSLESVQMDGVLEMGEGVFQNSGLTSIDLRNLAPSGFFAVNTFDLPGDTFRGCSKLVSVVLPQTLSSIGAYAFAGCTSLETVTVNADADSSLTKIYEGAFDDCRSLRTVILFARTIGDQAVEMAADTFADGADDLVVFVASGSPSYDRTSQYYHAETDSMLSYVEIYADMLTSADVRAAESETPSIHVPAYTLLLHDEAVSDASDVARLLSDLGLTVTDNASASEEIVVSVDAVYRTDILTEDGSFTELEGTGNVYDLSDTGRYLVYVTATDRFGNSFTDQVTLVIID